MSGCSTGVLNGCRFEKAFNLFITKHVSLLEKPALLSSVANDFTNHIMAHLSMIRYMFVANQKQTPTQARVYPKSGGFRRCLGPSELATVQPLVGILNPTVSSQPDAAATKKPDDIPLNSDGWPSIFDTVLEEDESPDMQRSDSRKTVLYDADGFPVCVESNIGDQTDEMVACPVEPRDKESREVDMVLVTPRSRTRKAHVASSRKKNPVQMIHGLMLGCSKCRYARCGCKVCRSLAFKGRRGSPHAE